MANDNMTLGWENHEPAPIEFLHSKVLEYFHEFRLSKTDNKNVEMDGLEFNRIIVKAKNETYQKYEKLNLKEPVLKTDLQ